MSTTPLPEDVVLSEVLPRVRDVKALFRCAMTCKRWLRLFTDPDFLRQLWPDQGHRARFLGLFSNRLITKPQQVMTTRQTTSSELDFVPRPGSPLGSRHAILFSSLLPEHHGLGTYVRPLASRGGILLLRFPHAAAMYGWTTAMYGWTTSLCLGLCNPITGTHAILPPLLRCTCLGNTANGYAIFTTADDDHCDDTCSPSSTFSRLLVVGSLQQDDGHVHVHSYSGATRSWSAPATCRHAMPIRMVGTTTMAGVVHRGAAHWLYIDNDYERRQHDHDLYILSAGASSSAGTARVKIIKLPRTIRAASPLLFLSGDDRLSIARMDLEHVVVWTQQQAGDPAVWLPAQVIQIAPVVAAGVNCFHFGKGAMLAVDNKRGAFLLDFETNVIEKILDLSPDNHGHLQFVPYEIDLPVFFMRQLAGLTTNRNRNLKP